MDTNLGQVVLVKDNIRNDRYGSYLRNFTEFNDRLYFTVDDGRNGRELFISDGTAEGTVLFADINPGSGDSDPSNFIEFNDQLYFAADNGESGRELFVSDGTAEGTQLLVDINPGLDNSGNSFSSNPGGFFEFNNKLYFSAFSEENGRELFVSDGTAEGTQLLVDINPGVDMDPGSDFFGRGYSSNPSGFAELNNKLYFIADDGESGDELFVSDGTAEGTQLLVDLRPGSDNSGNGYSSRPGGLTEFNDKLYFSAEAEAEDGENGRRPPFATDGTGENGGRELFVSDGTAEGTQLLVDLNPGFNYDGYYYNFSSSPGGFTEFDNKLYFSANDNGFDRELFVTDGTAEGTQLFANINPPGSSGRSSESIPFGFTVFRDRLFFSADDGENGRELFATDGTAEGTQLVVDINTFSLDRYNGSYPSNLTVVGDELFFAANDNAGFDNKLFKLTFDETVVTQPLNPSSGTANDDRLGGTDSGDEITGESTNDGITGGAGNDTINGLSGNDAIDGGAGNDILDGGEGTDTAVYQFAPGGVNVSLGEGSDLGMAMDGYGTTDSLSNIENIIGSEEDDNLTGNSGNNSLTGRNGNDTIAGLEGDDFLTGGNGADTISGGSGSDRFIYLNSGEGGDTITDFTVGVDKILLVSAGFEGRLPVGELPAGQFALGSSGGSEQRFIFNPASGELFFDADGPPIPGGQELIAILDGVTNLSAGDIMRI